MKWRIYKKRFKKKYGAENWNRDWVKTMDVIARYHSDELVNNLFADTPFEKRLRAMSIDSCRANDGEVIEESMTWNGVTE